MLIDFLNGTLGFAGLLILGNGQHYHLIFDQLLGGGILVGCLVYAWVRTRS